MKVNPDIQLASLCVQEGEGLVGTPAGEKTGAKGEPRRAGAFAGESRAP